MTNLPNSPRDGLIARLDFYSSITKDWYDNAWSAEGDFSLRQMRDFPVYDNRTVQSDDYEHSHIRLESDVKIGGKSFTISCYFSVDDERGRQGNPYIFRSEYGSSGEYLGVGIDSDNFLEIGVLDGEKDPRKIEKSINSNGEVYLLEYDYDHEARKICVYLDGEKIFCCDAYFPDPISLQNFQVAITDKCPVLNLADFRIYDGVAMHKVSYDPHRDKLKIWMPFDSTETQDLCGNTWELWGVYNLESSAAHDGLPAGAALACIAYQDDYGSGHLEMNGSLSLGGQSFSASVWVSLEEGLLATDGIILQLANETYPKGIGIVTKPNQPLTVNWLGETHKAPENFPQDNKLHLIELGYNHLTKKTAFFLDNVLQGEFDAYISNAISFTDIKAAVFDTFSTQKRTDSDTLVDDLKLYDGVCIRAPEQPQGRVIHLCLYHKGETYRFPFTENKTPPAVALMHDGTVFYNHISDKKSPLAIRYKGNVRYLGIGS